MDYCFVVIRVDWEYSDVQYAGRDLLKIVDDYFENTSNEIYLYVNGKCVDFNYDYILVSNIDKWVELLESRLCNLDNIQELVYLFKEKCYKKRDKILADDKERKLQTEEMIRANELKKLAELKLKYES